ncbi:hypothetical protein K7432_002393 [Basidiobolus ranarum]|uniref:Uncharacterized protein n=1 Tax=Basidiobolus ranarum TaxID=34480 RepID=A0ABR2W7T9_9FUNG
MAPATPRKTKGEIPSTPKTGLRNFTSPPVSSRLRSRIRKNERPVEEPASPSKESKTPLPKDKLTPNKEEYSTPIAKKTRNAPASRAKTQPIKRVSEDVIMSTIDTPKTTVRPRGKSSKKAKEQMVTENQDSSQELTVQVEVTEQAETIEDNEASEEPEKTTVTTPQLTSPPLVKRLRSRARKTEPRPTVAEPLSAQTPISSKKSRKAATMETPAPVARGKKEKTPKRNLFEDLVQGQEDSDGDENVEASVEASLGDNRTIPLDVKSPFKPGTPEAKPSTKKTRTALPDTILASPSKAKKVGNTQTLMSVEITTEGNANTPEDHPSSDEMDSEATEGEESAKSTSNSEEEQEDEIAIISKPTRVDTISSQNDSASDDSDSDDDAPEAISLSSGKTKALETKRQEREAAQKLADQHKNKRRETDAKLKQQKTAKKDRISQQKLPAVDIEVEEVPKPLEIPTTLPLDMLEMVADMETNQVEKPLKHGKHIRVDDFEAEPQPKKIKGEKDIGSIKVVSLANQTLIKPVPEDVLEFKRGHFYGDRVNRKNAVLNMSQKHKVAMKFRRS